jgi:hypothetical protein
MKNCSIVVADCHLSRKRRRVTHTSEIDQRIGARSRAPQLQSIVVARAEQKFAVAREEQRVDCAVVRRHRRVAESNMFSLFSLITIDIDCGG